MEEIFGTNINTLFKFLSIFTLKHIQTSKLSTLFYKTTE